MTANAVEEHGYFWWSDEPVPEPQWAPNSAVTGILRINNGGLIDLELHNVLPNPGGPFGAFVEGIPSPEKTIHGLLKGSGKSVVLLKLSRNGAYVNPGGISHEKYRADHAIVGTRELTRRTIPLLFQKMEVELKGFEKWLMLRNVRTKRTSSHAVAWYKAPVDIAFTLDDGTLTISHDMNGPQHGKHKSDQTQMVELASVDYSPKTAATLQEMRSQYGFLDDLLILLTGSHHQMEWPTLTYDEERHRCQFYFWRYTGSDKSPEWYECWVPFPKIQDRFGELFLNLRKTRQQFGPGIYLYLGTKRGLELYVENRFINLISGLEAMHRRTSEDTEVPKALTEKITRILEQVQSSKDKKWLEGQLARFGEPSLQDRLYDLFSKLPLGFNPEALREFCGECARRRNDMAHFGGDRHAGDYQDFMLDLSKKSDALSYLYHAVLLLEIGIGADILNVHVYRGFRSTIIKHTFMEVGLLPKSALKCSDDSNEVGNH